jgi:type II restriction enzyme
MPANTKAFDFKCSNCFTTYQVKSQRQLNLKRINDGAYSAMVAALRQNAAPNLFILHYSAEWTVKNLVLFPSVVFTEDILEKRNALSASARRAGWIGCNIELARVPVDAQIPMVLDAKIVEASVVREKYEKFRMFEKVPWELRGWTLDVFEILKKKIAKESFSLKEVYKYEAELAHSHPGNRNVKAKIRQQLQVLRDLGFISFLGHGGYALKPQSETGPNRR